MGDDLVANDNSLQHHDRMASFRPPHESSADRARITGISNQMLSQRLRGLEGHQLIERIVVPTTPVQITYRPTEGRCLKLFRTDTMKSGVTEVMPRLVEVEAEAGLGRGGWVKGA